LHPGIVTPRYVKELARGLRESMTETENRLWERIRLKQLGNYRFRAQHPIYRYILDFYCHEKKLAIEIDGGVHDTRKDYDNYRDAFLAGMNIKTVRFTSDEVMQEIDSVVCKIKEHLNRNN